MTAPPPAPFPDVAYETIPAERVLHRIHATRFTGDSFNPCLGRPTRFAPLLRVDGSCIPTAYAASTLESAAHETVFHEIQHDAPRKTIDFDVVAGLSHSPVELRRNLNVVRLFEPDLNNWGLTRTDLIDTYAADYPDTARWAVAIHDAHADAEGLVWTSRRCDPETAYVLFGDRVASVDLHVIDTIGVAGNHALIAELRRFGNRAGITLLF